MYHKNAQIAIEKIKFFGYFEKKFYRNEAKKGSELRFVHYIRRESEYIRKIAANGNLHFLKRNAHKLLGKTGSDFAEIGSGAGGLRRAGPIENHLDLLRIEEARGLGNVASAISCKAVALERRFKALGDGSLT